MRKTTTSVVVLCLMVITRMAITKNPFDAILVLSLIGFHECYIKRGGVLGPTNLIYAFVWTLVPWAYLGWIVIWETAMKERVQRKKIHSREDGRQVIRNCRAQDHHATIVHCRAQSRA